MFLLILAHIDTGHQLLIVKQIFGQSLGQLCLSHSRSTKKNERPDGTARILQACTATAYGIADGTDGLVLSDDTQVELFFQVKQFLTLALQHLAHGDSRPTAHHVSNVIGRHLFLDERITTLHLLQLLLNRRNLTLQGLQASIAYFGHLAIIALALGTFGLKLQLLNLLFVRLNFVDQSLLTLPLCLERGLLFLQFGNLLVQLRQLGFVLLPFDGFALNLQLLQPAAQFVQLFGYRVTLHTQLGGRLVHQVNGLVGQETLGNVAVAQFHGGNDGVVLNTHLMVVFIALLQSAQDADGAQHVRFVHHHRLETTLQCLVLFKILLIFIQRGGSDRAQFATCQSRFQNVGRIHSALTLTCSHKGMYFVNEKNNLPIGRDDLVDDGLQSLLKLTFIFGTSHQSTHVERIELLVLQILGHIATQDAVGKTFHDGSLSRTRFTY